MGNIALGREIQIIIKAESTAGTLVEPDATDNTSLVLSINTPTMTQERETFDDEQKRDTRSRLTPIAGRYLSGTWGFDTYIRPSGTAGSVPMENNLLYGLLGVRTINASTNVVYTLAGAATDMPSFSMWFKEGHTVYMCKGATINQGVFKIDGRTPGQISWSGGFMEKMWTGTDALTAAINSTSATSAVVADAYRYRAGSIILIESEALRVSAIADATTLTVTRAYKGTVAATHASAKAVTPWWPVVNETTFGDPQHGRLGYVQYAAANMDTLTNEITITNNIKYYEEEKNSANYCTAFGTPEMRAIEARVSMYFRSAQSSKFWTAYNWATCAISVPCGDVAGSIFTLALPQSRLKAPVITGDAERIMELTFLPYSTSSYNDEVSITYT